MDGRRAGVAGVGLAMAGVAAFLAAEGVSSIVRAELEGPPVAFASSSAAAAPTARDHATSADAIVEASPLDSERRSLRPKAAAPIASATPAARDDPYAVPICPTLRLAGSAQAARREDSRATLVSAEFPSGLSLREGDRLDGLAIVAIHWDRVWLAGDGGLCQAVLTSPPDPAASAPKPVAAPASSAIRTRGPGEAEVDRGFLEGIRADPSAFARGVKARFDPDGKGLVIADLKATSPLAAIGVQPGDRIESVNGFPLTSPEQALAAYAKLAVAEHATVRVDRNGAPVQLDVTVR